MNHVIFNGTDLTTFGLYVSGDKTFDSPEKNYTKVSIPGRSGDLYIWDGTYKNVKLKYDAILIPPDGKTFSDAAADLRNFLLSVDGYGRIEDDYNPDEYRMGVYSGPISFKPERFIAGKTGLEFNCMPQRWLKSGEVSIDLYDGIVINNPTSTTAKPIFSGLFSTGQGTVTIIAGDNSMRISLNPNERIFVDCETMDCFDDSGTPRNNLIKVDNEFISLPPGNTQLTIQTGSGFYDLTMTPRWFIL